MIDPSTLSDEERDLPRHPVGWYRKYGVTFVDLQPADVEFLRQWRNDDEIRRWMVLRETISPEEQEAWYRSIDPAREVYSIIWNHRERVGLCQLRHIDPEQRTGEGGIILFKPDHQNGLLAHRAAIAGLDWNFLERRLDIVRVTVLKTNTRARRLLRSLGYLLQDPDPAGEILRGEVTAAAYFRAASHWRAALHAEVAAEAAHGDVVLDYG